MHLKKISIFVLSFVLLYVPVAPVTASPMGGQMFTKGVAQINGVVAPQQTSVFPGDRIATGKDATTSLAFSGGDAVVITEMSKAALAERAGRTIVKLEEGTIENLSKSSNPVVIEAYGARILSASNQPAMFDVTLRGNSLRVLSRGGVVRVETSNKTADIQAGNELDATLAPPDPQSSAGMSSAEIWIIVAAATLGVAGVVLGAVALHKVDNCHLLSPSSPTIVC
jgi:ferric-dicitrate binding protein FerR (iron transport regulator)